MALIRDMRGVEHERRIKEAHRIILTTMVIATQHIRQLNGVKSGGFVYLPTASILEASGYDKTTYHMRNLSEMSKLGYLIKKTQGRKIYYCLTHKTEVWLVDSITTFAVAPLLLSKLSAL